jgi:hypothetical protein
VIKENQGFGVMVMLKNSRFSMMIMMSIKLYVL